MVYGRAAGYEADSEMLKSAAGGECRCPNMGESHILMSTSVSKDDETLALCLIVSTDSEWWGDQNFLGRESSGIHLQSYLRRASVGQNLLNLFSAECGLI